MVRVETSSWGRILGRHNSWAPPAASSPFPIPEALPADQNPTPSVASIIVRLGNERARLDIDASLFPLPNAPTRRALIFPLTTVALSRDMVKSCLTRLEDSGFVGWVESVALADSELSGFRRNGFGVRQSLRLLTHDLRGTRRTPKRPAYPYEFIRLATSDRTLTPSVILELLRVDHAAFPPDLGLDLMGLRHSLTATRRVMITSVWHTRNGYTDHNSPTARELVGFAVAGRVGRAAYLQRLAVDPAHQQHGLGRVLAHDALRWARHHGARRMIVNTQHTNHRALKLYGALGFVDAPTGLTVMGRSLARASSIELRNELRNELGEPGWGR